MLKSPVSQANLTLIMASFQEGINQPIRLASHDSRYWYEKTLQEELENHLNYKDIELLDRSFKERELGLRMARENRLDEAQIVLLHARQLFNDVLISKEATLVAESFQESAQAYLYYRQGFFEKAQSSMFNALAINAILQTEYNYSVLQFNSLEVARNILRMWAKKGNYQEALNLGSNLLDYLEGKIENLPLPGFWSSLDKLALPSQVLKVIFGQVTVELIHILSGPENKVVLWSRNIFPARSDQLNSDILHLQAHTWLQSKQALFAGDIDRFVTEAANGLSLGRQDPLLIWYAFILELIWFLRLVDTVEARDIEITFLKILNGWQQTPRAWLVVPTLIQ